MYSARQPIYDIFSGVVVLPPTSDTEFYTIQIDDQDNHTDFKPEHVFDENNVPSSGKPSDSLYFFKPEWLKQGQQVMILQDNVYKQGYLSLDKENLWEFVMRNRDGKDYNHIDLRDLQYSWKMRIQENTFAIGWDNDMARRVFNCRHVSAVNLKRNFSPPNLKTAFAASNADRRIWRDSYDEEYDGLKGLNVFDEITTEEYNQYLKIHGDDAKAIPTMNLFTVKPDMDGNPNRAKSRIVALGNLEQRLWNREDRYAPVLSGPAVRLLLSMAIEKGRRLRQGDCKNAFCNGILPDDEVCIVRPPLDCPRSKKGTFWKLNKTLYGLKRSAHHWFTKISDHLTEDMGFRAMDQDKCVFKATPFPGQPPIYVGICG